MVSRFSPVWQTHSRLLPPVGVAVAVMFVVWPIFGITPLSHDHPMHIFKAWIFWHEMLASGRLRGWSHTLAFGFPYGELTPPGAEMWVGLFRILTFGQLSWLHTYAIALAGALTLAAFATYFFTARFFGRWAGAVAAIFMILDPGGWAEGGWYWCVSFGVWPVTLALAFSLLALVCIDRILSSAPGRNGLWAATAIAFSVLVHQLSLLVYVVAVPFLLLDRCGVGVSRRRLRRLVLALALGMALAGFYFVPMLVHAGVTQDLGVPWITHQELSKRLVDLTIFDHMWPFTASLGIIGLLLALRERRPGGFALATAMAAFLLLSSTAFIDRLHAERLSLGLLKIESHRMIQIAKLFAFAFVGHAVVRLVDQPARTRARPLFLSVAVVRVMLLLAVLVPFVVPGFRRLNETHIRQAILPEGKTPFWSDLKAFFQWAQVERKSSPGFYRIAYELPFYDHLSALAPVFTGAPMYKVGATPSQQFRSLPTSNEPALYERLSVKWVLSDHPLANKDFMPERSFGNLRLYRFAGYHEAPFTLTGPGTAELIHFEPERLVFRLRGTRPDSHLTVHVAGYDRWQATLDGALLPIRPAAALNAEHPFLMELPARDGELVLRYVRRTVDWLGLGMSVAAFAMLAVVFWAKRLGLSRWLSPVESWLDRHSARMRKLALVAIAGLVALAIVCVARPHVQLPSTSLFTQEPQLALDSHPCESIGSLAWICGGDRIRATTCSGIYGNHYCVQATSGPLALTVNSFTGDAIYGRYDGGYQAKEGQIRVILGGQKIAETTTRGAQHGLQFLMYDLRPYWKPGGQTLRIEVDGSALSCLDFSTAFY